MNYKAYCKRTGLDAVIHTKVALQYPNHGSKKSGNVLSYAVPELTPDGTCSVGEVLAAEPYDLRPILNLKSPADAASAVTQIELLHTYIQWVQNVVGADWAGIYQKAQRADGTPVLVKLAYEGKPSRAEFPLTTDFAELSNNSRVGLTGKAVIITNVASHEGPYYKCDGAVQSELCLPVFDPSGQDVVGIIDLESFEQNHFDDQKIAAAADLCCKLSELLPLKR